MDADRIPAFVTMRLALDRYNVPIRKYKCPEFSTEATTSIDACDLISDERHVEDRVPEDDALRTLPKFCPKLPTLFVLGHLRGPH